MIICIYFSFCCSSSHHGLGHKSGLSLLPCHVAWQGHSATFVCRTGMCSWECPWIILRKATRQSVGPGSWVMMTNSRSSPPGLPSAFPRPINPCLLYSPGLWLFLIFLPLLKEIISFASASPFMVFCTCRPSTFEWEQIYTIICNINLHHFILTKLYFYHWILG